MWNRTRSLRASLNQISPKLATRRTFWTLDYPRSRMVSKEFVLAAVSEHAYWWIEQGLDVDDADLQRSVAEVEAQIYPRVTAAFGAAPGSVADPQRGHIINGRIPGVGGYVSGADPYPASVQPYSNGVPAIYINAREIPLGSPDYLTVLAHELQHAIHWYADPAEATWLNEGLSELAVTEAGYAPGSMRYYLRRPNASLVNWPKDLDSDIGLNYGAASLFAHYLRERYIPEGGLHDLLAGPDNGIAAVDAFLAEQGADNRRWRTRGLPLRVRRLDGGQPARRRWGPIRIRGPGRGSRHYPDGPRGG